MRKTPDKIKSNWKVLLITIVAVVAICSFIDWIWDTYGQDYALMWVSLFIAVIVAIVALSSLKITRDSLELTRATTRPFLTFTKANFYMTLSDGKPQLELLIYNTGALPAVEASVVCELVVVTHEGISVGTGDRAQVNLSVFLPKEERYARFFVPSELHDIIADNKETLMEVRIEYRFMQKECHTRRTLRLHTKLKRGRPQITHEFVSERNYWD